MELNTLDKEDAAEQAGLALNKLLNNNKNTPVLLMLSGGSALEILKEVGRENLGPNLTVTMLDERFSLDKTINNFGRLEQTDFYKIAEARHCNFIGTAIRHNETKEAFAERWEKRLRGWRQKHSGGKIFATLGMGADGHIAGIFPFPEDKQTFKKLFLTGSWLTAYSATGKNQYPKRITSNLTFFKLIDAAVAYISGEEKRNAFEKLISKKASIEEIPAIALRNIKNTQIFTDLR